MLRTNGFLDEFEASPRRYVPLEQFCDTVLRAIVGQACWPSFGGAKTQRFGPRLT